MLLLTYASGNTIENSDVGKLLSNAHANSSCIARFESYLYLRIQTIPGGVTMENGVKVWMDGNILNESEASVPIMTYGLHYGIVSSKAYEHTILEMVKQFSG